MRAGPTGSYSPVWRPVIRVPAAPVTRERRAALLFHQWPNFELAEEDLRPLGLKLDLPLGVAGVGALR